MISLLDKIRRQNLVWTVSEDYLAEGFEIFERDSFYEVSLIAYAYKVYDFKTFIDFAKENILNLTNRFDIMTIVFLILEENLKDELIIKRPGLKSYRKDFKSAAIRKNPKSFADEILKWYYETEGGSYPRTHENIVEILKKIRTVKVKNILDLIDMLLDIFKSYFHVENSTSIEKMEEIVEKAKKNPEILKSKPKSKNYLEDFQLEKYTIMSSEFFEESYENLKVVMETVEGETGETDFEKTVEKHFGKNILSKTDAHILESQVCTGIHKGIKIHMTKGDFPNESYYKGLIDEQKSSNREFYEKNHLTYKRGITTLKETIKNSLLKESEHYKIISNSGEVVPSKLWKIDRTSDNRVFKKEFLNDYGELRVDILLDSSASQHERASEVATQGYIIAEALSELNVKTRVVGFNNLFNYMVLNVFRDYEDSPYKNSEIFKYYPSGSNRDGLAIKTMIHMMKKSSAERKILIVLSDGKPNDEVNIASFGKKKLEAEDYVGNIAIYDTAMEVMNAKNIGINVLGVFTGEIEDLNSEKIIYGSDFAYITKMSRFSQIVGLFFKSVASKLE